MQFYFQRFFFFFAIKNRSGGSDITFQFFGAKNDGQKVREAVNRMVERGRLGNFSLVPTYLSFRQEPGLLLQVIYKYSFFLFYIPSENRMFYIYSKTKKK